MARKKKEYVVDQDRVFESDAHLMNAFKRCKDGVVYIGIDPGASGGISAFCDGEIIVERMPEEAEACRMLREMIDEREAVLFIEKVFAVRGQKSMQEYMTRAGSLMGAVYASTQVSSVFEIAPKMWQDFYDFDSRTKVHPLVPGLDARDKRKQQNARRADIKEVSRNLFAHLVPDYAQDMLKKSNDGMSDSFLILLYGVSVMRVVEKK